MRTPAPARGEADLWTQPYVSGRVLRRSDGSGYDRQGYIDALAQGSDYELVNYKITDVEARQDGDILVDGKPVTSQPSPSLVTFVRVGGQWKLASDAFFSK